MRVATLVWVCLLSGLFTLSGCLQGRESLHEMDHVLPTHWPADLGDAADKLRQRLRLCQGEPGETEATTQAARELKEIVEWLPEIAADTDLPEEDWDAIYQQVQGLRNQLGDSAKTVAMAAALESLTEIVEQKALLVANLSNETGEGP